jgi:putative heme-binding domain-containing protein
MSPIKSSSNRSAVMIFAALFCGAVAVCAVSSHLAAQSKPPGAAGIAKRVPWTTSRITGSPETPLPYVTANAFPGLKFKGCLDIAQAPGGDRLFVAEQGGKIYSFVNQPNVRKSDLVADLAKQIKGVEAVYALEFHPDFQKNGYLFVCYVKAQNITDGSHIARFRVNQTNPPTIDMASETTIITWLSGGHNGCCLKFGPDGYLYVSTGDGSGPNPPDSLKSGQDLSNLLSSVLRLDVDHVDGDRNYRIPDDNPFVDLKGARGEIWAYGLRNPWRMSFDRKTGDLWVGDVGWEMWEMLDRIERGGNYGWSIMEGRQSTNPERLRGPTPILSPTLEHPHSESSSITDGLTYYGSRLPELHGHHLYGDYDTGKIWGFRYENGKVTEHREIADTTLRIVGFGADAAGECYLLDHVVGTIHQLVPNPRKDEKSNFPRLLSESGLFSELKSQTPEAGVIPYSINAEAWADYATAERFVALPKISVIRNTGNAWVYPKDAVLVKTLSLDIRQNDPASRRRVETQLLHFDGRDWQPYTYEWNDDQSEATLVPAAGLERSFDIDDAQAPGGIRKQTWHFSGRGECQRCHNKWSGSVLGFSVPQLSKPGSETPEASSPLDTLIQLKLFANRIGEGGRPGLANPHNLSASLDARARAYLHANCAHCHRDGAGGSVLSKMSYDLSLQQTDMEGIRPTQGTFGIHAAQVLAPGDPFRSILLYRMAKLGGGRMPHVGSSEVDRAGVALISDWIQQLPESVVSKPADQSTAKLRSEENASLKQLLAAEKSAARGEAVKRLLSSTSGALMLLQAIDRQNVPQDSVELAVDQAAKHNDVSVRDLFERFLPVDKRSKRLGNAIQPEQILALTGDIARGKSVFFENAGVSCKNCHRVQNEGKEVGPELTLIGKKLTRIQLLESILEPSKLIEPKYVTYLAEIDDGRIVTGLLVSKDANEVVLKDANDKLVRLPVKQIEQLVPQRQSLMPDLLLRDLTGQQVADLLEYLGSLK